ncbi:MAG TPA: STAS domain-containing protein [Blastocatellia bacterium]|nr:STAS domain-containing protein [Blastocatellia bacterium]
MDISTRSVGQVAVIDLHGSLILRENADELFDKVAAFIASGSAQILVNLSDLARMDSYGIGIIIKSFKTTKSAGGHFKLTSPSSFVRQLLTISGLMTLLEVFDSESAAIASF